MGLSDTIRRDRTDFSATTASWPFELLDAFRTGDGVHKIRESVRTVLQELVELEVAGVIGPER